MWFKGRKNTLKLSRMRDRFWKILTGLLVPWFTGRSPLSIGIHAFLFTKSLSYYSRPPFIAWWSRYGPVFFLKVSLSAPTIYFSGCM